MSSSLLTNKHFLVALIVAPILAILSYFAVDYTVSEKPHKAVKGESYPLVAKSNCRYKSGKCTFENGEVSISLFSEPTGSNSINITLVSDLPLQGIKMGLSTPTEAFPPKDMLKTKDGNKEWLTEVNLHHLENARLQLAISVNNTLYYGETETIFTTYQTGFTQDNISK